jgi:HAD superfamily hydrolase (TIGR01509 family)
MAPLLRPLPGARTLLQRVAALDLKVVLATPTLGDPRETELALLRKVLDCDDLVAEVTSAADLDTAKPKPDIIHVALQRAGVSAEQAVFVGDAIWDAEACARAHVTSIGVLSGGVSRDELENAGAVMVFENSDDLVRNIEETPIARLDSIGSS